MLGDEPCKLAFSDIQERYFGQEEDHLPMVLHSLVKLCSSVSELPKSGVKELLPDICQKFTCSLFSFL